MNPPPQDHHAPTFQTQYTFSESKQDEERC
jgi:hypothetical protein